MSPPLPLTCGRLDAIEDIGTFVLFRAGFKAGDAAFRSAWFVKSLMAEVVVLLAALTVGYVSSTEFVKAILLKNR